MHPFINAHRGLRAAAIFIICYLVAAIAALSLTKGVSGIAAIWPASGVMLAGTMLLERKARRILFAGCFLASILANGAIGSPWLTAVAYGIANVAEAWIARFLILRFCRATPNIADPYNIFMAGTCAVLAALCSATVAAVLTGNYLPGFVGSWATTVFFGMVTVAPALLFISADWDRVKQHGMLHLIPVMACVVAISCLTFWQTTWPLLWLPVAVAAFATHRLGLTGAALSMLVLALNVAVHSSLGRSLPGQIPQHIGDATFLQIYLVGVLVSILPLAALLENQKSMLGQLAEAKQAADVKAAEAERIAATDSLTGVANRTRAMACLTHELARCAEEGKDFSLLMIDVDHFKSINDRFGHAAGDRALIRIAREGEAVAGERGLFARIGGEEFLLLMPGASVRDATSIAEEIQRRVRAIDWSDSQLDGLTLSIGVAQHEGKQSLSELLSAADERLYRAKSLGRDCVQAAA